MENKIINKTNLVNIKNALFSKFSQYTQFFMWLAILHLGGFRGTLDVMVNNGLFFDIDKHNDSFYTMVALGFTNIASVFLFTWIVVAILTTPIYYLYKRFVYKKFVYKTLIKKELNKGYGR